MDSVETFMVAVQKAIQKIFPRPADRMAFQVRRGITFPGIELFCDNRVAQINPKKIEQNIQRGTVDEMAEHLVRMVRGKTIIAFKPEIYRRQDLIREQYMGLKQLLGVVMDPAALQKWEDAWTDACARTAEVKKPTDVILYPYLVNAAMTELTARLSKREE